VTVHLVRQRRTAGRRHVARPPTSDPEPATLTLTPVASVKAASPDPMDLPRLLAVIPPLAARAVNCFGRIPPLTHAVSRKGFGVTPVPRSSGPHPSTGAASCVVTCALTAQAQRVRTINLGQPVEDSSKTTPPSGRLLERRRGNGFGLSALDDRPSGGPQRWADL